MTDLVTTEEIRGQLGAVIFELVLLEISNYYKVHRLLHSFLSLFEFRSTLCSGLRNRIGGGDRQAHYQMRLSSSAQPRRPGMSVIP